MKYKISIIVPSYNHALHLKKRLESILDQTYQNFELILLDDASTDNSVEILKKYETHPNVSHFLINDENSGNPFLQWQKGIDLAKGEYIWIAESDDWADEQFLEEMIELSKQNPNSVLMYSQSLLANEEGEDIESNIGWTNDLDTERWSDYYSNNGMDEIKNYLSIKNSIPNASAVVFKRETLNLVDWEPELVMLGDWLLWIKLLQHGSISYSPKRLNHFRFSSNNSRKYDSFSKKLTHAAEELFILRYLKSSSLSGELPVWRVIRLKLKRVILQVLGVKKTRADG